MARRKRRRRRNGVREVRTLSRFARARMLRGTRRLARLAGMSPRATDALSQARSWRASYGRRNPADSGKVDARRRIRYVVTYQGQPVPGAITLKRAEAWRWADRLTRQTGYLYAVGRAGPGVPLPRRNPAAKPSRYVRLAVGPSAYPAESARALAVGRRALNNVNYAGTYDDDRRRRAWSTFHATGRVIEGQLARRAARRLPRVNPHARREARRHRS